MLHQFNTNCTTKPIFLGSGLTVVHTATSVAFQKMFPQTFRIVFASYIKAYMSSPLQHSNKK